MLTTPKQPAAQFEDWLATQKAAGLVDLRVTLSARPGATVADVQRELLEAEAAIAAGRTCPLPGPDTWVPSHIRQTIAAVRLAG